MLHIDLETYSPVSLKDAGVYPYSAHPDFRILLFAYSFGGAVILIDFEAGETIPPHVLTYLLDNDYKKAAHRAQFERVCLAAAGYVTSPRAWYCTAVKASYCGLPMSLANVSEALNLGDDAKDKAGAALIKLFCIPVKPTKKNPDKVRNLPTEHPKKWEQFGAYCVQDVVAELAVFKALEFIEEPASLWEEYAEDQHINQYGINIDRTFAEDALRLNAQAKANAKAELIELTGLANPNSRAQLLDWLNNYLDSDLLTLQAEDVKMLLDVHKADTHLCKILELKQMLSKTSTSKYKTMLDAGGIDGRVRGCIQFYGAHTGRWAGRLIQPHNLTKSKLRDLEGTREMFKWDPDLFAADKDLSSTLASLIRTALIPPPGYVYRVADFSAIEARVLSWIARSAWRLEVFRTHGKIYEATAAEMFNVPLEAVTKDSDYRARGKVSELALGYGGSSGAMVAMGAEKMGMSSTDIADTVRLWRQANPDITAFWKEIERACLQVVSGHEYSVEVAEVLQVSMSKTTLCILLPSGRALHYWNAHIGVNKFGSPCVCFTGFAKNKVVIEDTYGGKLTENIVQAIARDLMAYAISNMLKAGYKIPFHVHDEIIAECLPEDKTQSLPNLCALMSRLPEWAAGLPLDAEGYESLYYKKD